MRDAFRFIRAGADAVYCAASLDTIRALADEHVAVAAIRASFPHHSTWTGGFRAVGKTAETAMFVWKQVKALEAAGAFAAEIEVVPVEVASAISARTSLFMISMGAGPAATRSTSSPKTFWATIAATIRATPRSTAISPPNTTGCRPSASPHSANMSPTCAPAPIRSRSMWSASNRTSSKQFLDELSQG